LFISPEFRNRSIKLEKKAKKMRLIEKRVVGGDGKCKEVPLTFCKLYGSHEANSRQP